MKRTPASHRANSAALPPERAFVVQLREPGRSPREKFRGRVEHVTSGRSGSFSSLAELADFIEPVLAQLRNSPEKPR